MELGSPDQPTTLPATGGIPSVPRRRLATAAVLVHLGLLGYVGAVLAAGAPPGAMLLAWASVGGAAVIGCAAAYALARQAQAVERLADENRGLRAATVKKDEFLASVSHELRTPLNVVLGYVDLLLDHSFGALEPAQRDILHRITKNASNLSHLINDLIDLSRIDAGRLKIEVETVDLAPLVGEMRNLMDLLLAGHDVTFSAELAPGCARVRADAERLKQIVSNLLVNAVKFTECGSITLRAESIGAGVTISVTDTGIGIPAVAHRAIFEPFRQVHDRSRQTPGAGIGLSISSRLAQLMGGTLAVESEPGRGSCFVLTLPAAAGAPVDDAEPLRRVC